MAAPAAPHLFVSLAKQHQFPPMHKNTSVTLICEFLMNKETQSTNRCIETNENEMKTTFQ
jgi:hypothetical protein